MYHLNPSPPNRVTDRIFARGVDEVRDDGWLIADDGLLVTLPARSDEIETTSR